MATSHRRSSDIMEELFGDVSKYEEILNKWSVILSKNYPDKKLSQVFSGLSSHIISIMPMVFCDSLATDLGKRAKEEQLAAIGLSCLLISTHDDVVDELPAEREIVADLVYGGNIAAAYGFELLLDEKNRNFSRTLVETIARNHYLQVLVVKKLWQGKTVSMKQYFDGIEHICVFASIGPLCALALAGKETLKSELISFSRGYGVALQLIDDIREIEEDKTAGYTSFPLIEGHPFKISLRELNKSIQIAKSSLKPEWRRMGKLVLRLEAFADSLKEEIDED